MVFIIVEALSQEIYFGRSSVLLPCFIKTMLTTAMQWAECLLGFLFSNFLSNKADILYEVTTGSKYFKSEIRLFIDYY